MIRIAVCGVAAIALSLPVLALAQDVESTEQGFSFSGDLTIGMGQFDGKFGNDQNYGFVEGRVSANLAPSLGVQADLYGLKTEASAFPNSGKSRGGALHVFYQGESGWKAGLFTARHHVDVDDDGFSFEFDDEQIGVEALIPFASGTVIEAAIAAGELRGIDEYDSWFLGVRQEVGDNVTVFASAAKSIFSGAEDVEKMSVGAEYAFESGNSWPDVTLGLALSRYEYQGFGGDTVEVTASIPFGKKGEHFGIRRDALSSFLDFLIVN